MKGVSMKFSFSLESVNMLTSGSNFIYKQSKGFWVNYFKYISAAGFRAIELPFNPFNSDPMAFETGRCGIPCNSTAIRSKYGSPEEFLAFLKGVGIDAISSVRIGANDAMLEVLAAQLPPEAYYHQFQDMHTQALDHCASLKCDTLVVSPSPELGWLKAVLADDLSGNFEARTLEILKNACEAATRKGITLALMAEYWSFFRGDKLAALVAQIPGAKIAPDLAHMHIANLPVEETLRTYGAGIACPRLTDTAFTDSVGNFQRINAEIPVEGSQKVFADLGDGVVNLAECASIIEASGYTGYVVCEQKKTLDVYRGLLKLRWYLDHEIVGR